MHKGYGSLGWKDETVPRPEALMSTLPNRLFLLFSILIHLVVFLAVGHMPIRGPHQAEPPEPVAVRFIDFSPRDSNQEEIPDTAKIWSSKATKAHGGVAERIAERSASTLTASTPPKGKPFSFQRKDSSSVAEAPFLPDEPPSAQWLARRLTAIAALERPIRLELDPLVSDEATTPRIPLRSGEDKSAVLEELEPLKEFEEAQARTSQTVPRKAARIELDAARLEPLVTTVSPPASASMQTKPRALDVKQDVLPPAIPAVRESGPPEEAAEQITDAATEPSASSPPEPLLSSPQNAEMPIERERTSLPIEGEGLAALAEGREQTRSSISLETERPTKEPAQLALAGTTEIAPLPLKESNTLTLPLEAPLAEDLPPSEAANPQREPEVPEVLPDQTEVRGPAPKQQREKLEPDDAPETKERAELLELARRVSRAAKPRTRLRLEGTPAGSPKVPKAGKEILGPEELFPAEIIEKYAAMESDDLDLTDVSDAVSLDTNELRYFSYFAKIKKEIEEQWRYPPQAALRGQHGAVSLLFVMDQTGKVKDVRFWNTSGYALLDAAARDAILKADPFPPFPEHLRKERSTLRINARFIYELYGTI